MTNIVETIDRPSNQLLEQISPFSPATLHEAQGRRGALSSRIKPIYSGMRAGGPAFTVSCHPGDNLMLITAISLAKPGDVVVHSGGHSEQGGFGEVLATACKARGIAALVTDGSVRDGAGIRALGFDVFAAGLCVRGTVKETLGFINQPIVIGEQLVRPGDYIAADDDGVVVVRKEDIAEVARDSQSREEKEARIMQQLRDGQSILELSGMNQVLAAKNCVWENAPPKN